MRRHFLLLLVVILIFCSACSPNANVEDSDKLSDLESATPETPFVPEIKAEVVESVFYTVPEYYNGIYAAAVIKNTGNVIIEFDKYKCSFDVEDANGNFLLHIDNVTIEPQVLGGENGFAYMAALDLQSDIDLSQCARIIANIEYDSAYAITIPIESLEIEDISFTEYSGHFYATPGRVVNHNQYDVDRIVPIIALYDRDDNFIGVNITSKSLNVKAGEKLGFSGESSAPLPLSAFSKEDLETFNIIAVGSSYSELPQ